MIGFCQLARVTDLPGHYTVLPTPLIVPLWARARVLTYARRVRSRSTLLSCFICTFCPVKIASSYATKPGAPDHVSNHGGTMVQPGRAACSKHIVAPSLRESCQWFGLMGCIS